MKRVRSLREGLVAGVTMLLHKRTSGVEEWKDPEKEKVESRRGGRCEKHLERCSEGAHTHERRHGRRVKRDRRNRVEWRSLFWGV